MYLEVQKLLHALKSVFGDEATVKRVLLRGYRSLEQWEQATVAVLLEEDEDVHAELVAAFFREQIAKTLPAATRRVLKRAQVALEERRKELVT